MMSSQPKVCAVNFWPDFRLETGFLGFLLRQALGPFEAVADEAVADLVLTSVFVQRKPLDPARTLAVVWENVRPNFDLAHHALSFDFDSYGGRNCRCPYWYSQLAWPGFEPPKVRPNDSNHGFEPLVAIDTLTKPRAGSLAGGRERFCAFVAGNPEGHRMLAAEMLQSVGPVDVWGNVARRPLRGSKLDLFRSYRFALCFENSIFPGYYTEKPLHAWAAGAVPLYFADPLYGRELNPKALVNRIDFATLADFAAHVGRLEASADARAEIVAEPLLREPPSLEPVIAFVREVSAKAAKASRPALPSGAGGQRIESQPPAQKPSRNGACWCGSGLKFKRCHGK